MNTDAADLREMEKLLRRMDAAALVRFCEGSLRAAGLGQRVLLERFPEAWVKFNDDVENGRIS